MDDELDLQPFDEEETDETDESAGTPDWFDPNLATDRRQFAEELKSPIITGQLFNLTHREVGNEPPEAQQAFMETVFNRASSRGMTLGQTLNDRTYYPDVSMQRANYTEQDALRYHNLATNAWKGSNLSRYATGNASYDPITGRQVGFNGGPKTYQAGRESFGIEGPDLRWYERADRPNLYAGRIASDRPDRPNRYLQRIMAPDEEFIEVRRGRRAGGALPKELDLQPFDERGLEPPTARTRGGLKLEYFDTNLPPEEQELLGILQRHRREAAAQGIYPRPERQIPGVVAPGNIDINNRPVVKNPEGGVSTELSFSRGIPNYGEVLVPRVVDGQILSEDEAWKHYELTGQHLGVFNSPEVANTYAEMLHKRSLPKATGKANPVYWLRSAENAVAQTDRIMAGPQEVATPPPPNVYGPIEPAQPVQPYDIPQEPLPAEPVQPYDIPPVPPSPESAQNWFQRNLKLPEFKSGPGRTWLERNFKARLATQEEYRKAVGLPKEVLEADWDKAPAKIPAKAVALAARYSFPLTTLALDAVEHFGPKEISDQVKTAREGLSESAAETVTSMTTPKNTLILGATVLAPYVGVPAFVGTGVSLGFSVAALKAAIDEARHLEHPGTPEWWKGIGNIGTDLVFAGVTAFHGGKGVRTELKSAAAARAAAAAARARSIARVTPGAAPPPLPGVGPPTAPVGPVIGPAPAPAATKGGAAKVVKEVAEAAEEGPAVEATGEAPRIAPIPIKAKGVIGAEPEAKPSDRALKEAEADAEIISKTQKFESPEARANWTKNRAIHHHLEETTNIIRLEEQAADLQNEVGYWLDHHPKTRLERNAFGRSQDALWKTWDEIHDIWDAAGLRWHMVQIGGGAGGLKGAHQAAYEGLRTLVIEKETTPSGTPETGGAAKRSMELINVGAKGTGIIGREYFREQEITARNTGAKIIAGEAVDMKPATDGSGGVDIFLKDGRVIKAHRVSAMTGTRPNVHPFEGSDLTGWKGNAETLTTATMKRKPFRGRKGVMEPGREGRVGIVHGSGNSATQAVIGAIRHGAKKIIMISRSEFGPEVSPNQRNRIKRYVAQGKVELITGSPTEVIRNPDGTLRVKVGPSKEGPHTRRTLDNIAHFENFLDRLTNTEWFPKNIERLPGGGLGKELIKTRGASLKTNMEGVYVGGDIRESGTGELRPNRINYAQGDATGNANRIAADIAILHSKGKLPKWTEDLTEQQIDQVLKEHRRANKGLTSRTGGAISGSRPPTSSGGWPTTSEPREPSLQGPGERAAEAYLARVKAEPPPRGGRPIAAPPQRTQEEVIGDTRAALMHGRTESPDFPDYGGPATIDTGPPEVSRRYRTVPPVKRQQATEFYSPNEGTLDFDGAITELKKPNHQKAAEIADDIDGQLGLKGPTRSGVADTVEWGAENSLVHTIENLRDFDELRYSAALKGRALNQKSVLAFQAGDGPDALHTTVVPNKNLHQIRKTFTEHGVPNKTLLPEGKNTRIVVYDPGHTLADNVASAANEYGARKIQTQRGRGEFVGQGDTREEARNSFNAITKDYETRYPDRRHYGAKPGQGRYGNRPARLGEPEHTVGQRPDEDLASPKLLREESPARPQQPIVPPPLPAGQVLSMGDLPVTMERTGPGNVAPADVMDALKSVMTASGSAGEIHGGRFQTRTAKGIFRPFSEVVRLEHIDDIPTAVHETGHALMKQMYGSVKSRALSGLPPPVKNELVGLGKALYGNRRPTAGYTGEGFSEFMRYYLTRDDAAKVAPATTRFFENKVLGDFPEVAAQLRAARDLIDMYRAQGAMARANAQIQEEAPWTRRVLGALNDALGAKAQFESALPLRSLVKEAERQLGRKIPASQDPYKLFKARRGASSVVVDTMVHQNMVDVWGRPVGPSLEEAFAEVRGTAEGKRFGLYTYARRAAERWKKLINPGISQADAEYIKQTLESPKFDKAFSKYQQWWDGVLAYAVQADPKLVPLVARIKQGSSDYAPLARVLDERAVRREVLKSQANPLYRMHGSGLPVKPIFEQSIVNAARLVSMANRALITNAIFKLSRVEGMGHYMHKVDRAQVMRQVNVDKIRDELENMGVDTSNIPADKMIDYYTPADVPKGTDPIYKYVNTKGETEWYYMDPDIYQILSKIEPFSLRALPHIGPALDVMVGAPKRAFTLGTTGMRPTFSLVTNPLRDPQAWIMQTKTHANPAKMAAAYFQAMKELLLETATGHVGPYSKAVNNLGPQMAQPLGRDIRYTRRAAKGLFHGRMFQIVRTPIDHLRSLLNVPEAFPRLAEFMLLAKEVGWKPGQPMTPDQATELALGYKEATVDFSAAGDVSRVMNEAVPFYNPTMQGARTMVRAFREHPYRTVLLGLGLLTGPTLWNWWKNKDQEWYQNLPYKERYFSNHIDDGKNVWVIPRPFEYGNIFQVMPEAMMDTWYRNDPRAVKEAIGYIFESQSPIQPSILPIITDTVAGRTAKEQWSNKIDFWDRPIVPRSEADLSPGAQVGPYTSKVAIWLGKAFPNTVSPKRADAAIKSYLGGAVPDLLDAIGLGAQKKDRESERADLPVIGKLWRRGGYYNGQSQHIADFYDIKETMDARAQAEKRQLRDPTRVQTMPLNPEDLVFSKLFDSNGRAITMTLRIADQIKESKGRQIMYREAAMQAKQIVDMYRNRQKLNGDRPY